MRILFGVHLIPALVLLPLAAGAQTLPAGPVSAFDGRLAVGAEVVATVGDADDVAFFNYTDYEHNVLRMLRVALSAEWRPSERLAVVGEVRSEDLGQVRPYAAYLRIRPWRTHAFNVQVGRIPPAFGSFGRRTYYPDNPLIGYPLAYQYLTSLRADAIPATIDDLLFMRARGWRTSYPVGSAEQAPGVPLISAFQWDTGVQAHWSGKIAELTGAVTSGTLSDPKVGDNNDGKQVSGRLAVRPRGKTTGLVVGASAAHGEWLDRSVERLLPSDLSTSAQTAFGVDGEYSRDYWLIRSELVWTRWNVPFVANGAQSGSPQQSSPRRDSGQAGQAGPGRVVNLDALAMWVEGRYRLTPRIFVAARVDHLGFSKIAPNPTVRAVPWDAPVTRVEGNIGYYFQRNLVGRVAVQHNDRDAGRIRTRTYLSGQLGYWF